MRNSAPHSGPGDGKALRLTRRKLFADATVAGAGGLLAPALRDGTANASGSHERASKSIRPAPVMKIEDGDSRERILEKASKILPREAQIKWQQNEVTAFTHFGMNTFTDREWGSGAEDEAWFHPKSVNIEQWMRAYKAMGAKQVMLTVKHHDGFVLYPTRYSNHSVIASPWWVYGRDDTTDKARKQAQKERTKDASAYWQVRNASYGANPKGDILGRYVQAAKKAGLKVGVYLSPADGAELPHTWHNRYVEKIRKKDKAGEQLSVEEQSTLDDSDRSPSGQGRYGADSGVTTRTIPTLVRNDDRTKRIKSGQLPSFTVHADDYNAYYMNQLYELFTQYGPIHELWLDGANPWSDAGIAQDYDFTGWFKLIKQLSPETVVFGGPQGVRWVGNEDGIARKSEWSVTPATADPSTHHNEELLPDDPSADDIGSRDKITDAQIKYLQWFPAESDACSRDGWFYHADEQPKSAARLQRMYEETVGRNSVLLLNVAPDTHGVIPRKDVTQLTRFGRAIDAIYQHNKLPPRGRVQRRLANGKLSTGWSPRHGATTGAMTLDLGRGATFDRIRLGENIHQGQRVEEFVVEMWKQARWQKLTSGTSIGYSRILILDERVSAMRLRIRIERSRATPHLATVGLYDSHDAQ